MDDHLRKALDDIVGLEEIITDAHIAAVKEAIAKDFDEYRAYCKGQVADKIKDRKVDGSEFSKDIKYTEVQVKMPKACRLERLNNPDDYNSGWRVVIEEMTVDYLRIRFYDDKKLEPFRITMPYPLIEFGFTFIGVPQLDGSMIRYREDEYELKIKDDAKVGGEGK